MRKRNNARLAQTKANKMKSSRKSKKDVSAVVSAVVALDVSDVSAVAVDAVTEIAATVTVDASDVALDALESAVIDAATDAAIADDADKAIAAHAELVAAYAQRAIDCPIQASFFNKESALFNVACVRALLASDVDVSALATTISNSNKNSGNAFLAKYAVEKVRKIAQAIALSMFSALDRYTQAILLNSRKLETLSAKSALVCLSRNIEYAATDAQQIVRRYGHCEATTASTQRSSTREALRVLNVASVTKAKRDDAIVFTDTKIANAVASLTDATLAL